MCKSWIKLTGVAAAAMLLIPDAALAAGAPASFLVIVADTRFLTGWQAWFANLYNESHLYFAIFTVVAIPVIGCVLGFLADLVMQRLGINLKSRELAEH